MREGEQNFPAEIKNGVGLEPKRPLSESLKKECEGLKQDWDEAPGAVRVIMVVSGILMVSTAVGIGGVASYGVGEVLNMHAFIDTGKLMMWSGVGGSVGSVFTLASMMALDMFD